MHHVSVMRAGQRTRLQRDALHWPEPPQETMLAPNEIHVIAVALDAPDARVTGWLAALSDDERERAARFHFALDRDRFSHGRAALRGVLSRYTGLPPSHLSFVTGDHGKPSLHPSLAHGLHFNLSHAAGLALLAVTRLAPVGIDVEAIAPLPDLLDIASRFFAPAEFATVRSLESTERLDAFFTCWTRKEAYIKAVGAGLSLALDRFVVSVRADEAAHVVDTGEAGAPASEWTLVDLRPARHFAGALAIPHREPIVRCWRW